MAQDIDVDQLSAAAARLTGVILESRFLFFDTPDKHKARLTILAVMMDFLQTDSPCDLQTTTILIEDVLKDTDDTEKSLVFLSEYNTTILDRNAQFNLLLSQINFDVRASGKPSDLIGYDRKQGVFNEIQKCRNAAINHKPYSVSPLCDNLLSSTADRNNNNLFENLHKQFVKDVKKYNISNTHTNIVEDYLATVFRKVVECQNVLNPQKRFSHNVEKRREQHLDDGVTVRSFTN